MNTITRSETNKPDIRIIKKKTTAAPKNILFEKIDDNTMLLQFGMARLEFHSDGAIFFKNDKSTLSLAANGVVQLEGVEIINKSQKNIQLEADQNIYFNAK